MLDGFGTIVNLGIRVKPYLTQIFSIIAALGAIAGMTRMNPPVKDSCEFSRVSHKSYF